MLLWRWDKYQFEAMSMSPGHSLKFGRCLSCLTVSNRKVMLKLNFGLGMYTLKYSIYWYLGDEKLGILVYKSRFLQINFFASLEPCIEADCARCSFARGKTFLHLSRILQISSNVPESSRKPTPKLGFWRPFFLRNCRTVTQNKLKFTTSLTFFAIPDTFTAFMLNSTYLFFRKNNAV